MSVSGRCSEISCADDRNANLEHIMVEFTASTCPSLRGKPWLFFLQHFKGTSWVNDECSVFASRSFTEKDTVRLLCIFTSEKDSCPEEADFLRICVTSTYPADQPNREQGGGALEDFGGGVTMFSGEKRWRSVVANRTS